MQRILTIVAFVCCGALTAGCRGASGPSADWRDGTHNVRSFAAMSMPAFLPDGSKFVANGTKLLKFSAGDALLDTIELPIIPANQYSAARVISTKAGSVFVLLGDGRVGLIDAQRQLLWLQDFKVLTNSAVAFGDGLLTWLRDTGPIRIGMLGADGQVKFELAAEQMLPDADATADSGHAYFTSRRHLWVADTAGAWTVQDLEVAGMADPRLICAGSGRVLISDRRMPVTLACCDSSGAMVWSVQLPENCRVQGPGILTPGGTALVPEVFLPESGPTQDMLQRYAADGTPLSQLAGISVLSLSVLDENHFAAAFWLDQRLQYGLFTNTGELLWNYAQPTRALIASVKPWDDRSEFTSQTAAFCGPDRRIYFEWQSTLYALDMQGRLAWREAGHEYTDKEVPNSSGPTNPGTQPPSPATGGNKPAP